jgi:hypothetical protein
MLSTHSNVSYGALLGGALVGVLAWGAWKRAAGRSEGAAERSPAPSRRR